MDFTDKQQVKPFIEENDIRDIQEHLADIYGASVSPATISNITDEVLPAVTAWRNRPLEESYAIVYQLAVDTWQRNWERISTMYQFSPEIRRLIYTTNPIESFNRQLRKVTKNRGVFPNDDAVLKLLYLATGDIVKKWTMKIVHWNQILAQLAIHFGDRVTKYLS